MFNRHELTEELVENPKSRRKSLSHAIRQDVFLKVKYNHLQVLKTALIHFSHLLFGPFVLPLLRYTLGACIVKNMFFRWCRIYSLYEFMPWLWIILTVLVAKFVPDIWPKYIPFILSIASLIVVRETFLCLKYGYYSKSEWNRIETKQYPLKALEYQILIKSWIKVPLHIAKEELGKSFKRLRINPQNYIFEIYDMDQKSKSDFLSVTGQEFEEQIDLETLADFLIQKITRNTKTYEKLFVIFHSVVFASLPIVAIFLSSSFYDCSIFELMYCAYSIILVLNLTQIFLKFNMVGVYDFSRKKKLMNFCSKLISCDSKCLKIRLESSESIIGWYYMRTAFLDFGRRFTYRIFLYSSLSVPIVLGLILVIILMVFSVISEEYIVLLIPWVYLVIIMHGILFYMASTACELNQDFDVHIDLLLQHITSYPEHPSAKTIWTVIEKLKQDEKLKPITICGIKIDSSFLAKWGALGVSAVIALIRIFV